MLSHRNYLERNANWRSEEPALQVVKTDETLSWGEFNQKANQFGNALTERGVRKGDRVGIILYNTLEFPITVYGCYKIGAIPVPMNYMLSGDSLQYIFDDVNPEIVVFDDDVSEKVEAATDRAVREPDLISTVGSASAVQFSEFISAGSTRMPPEYPLQAGETVYILYTSGTTGQPKGVTFTAKTADRRAIETLTVANITQDSVSLQLSPWFHAGGIDNTVHPTIAAGGQLLVQNDFEPEPTLDAIEQYGVTHISSVPTLTKRIAESDGINDRELSSIECWINMGSPLSRSNAEQFMDVLTPHIYNNYGTTETLIDTSLRPEDLPEHAGTIGRPAPDKEVRIVELDSNTNVTPEDTIPSGQKGQIIVRGDPVFDGYYGNMDATRRSLRDGWFYTKDVGLIDENGYLTITGRADDMVVSGGELVSPVEVEGVLEEHPDVEAAIVVGVPDDEWGERVKAIIATNAAITADALEEYCREYDGIAGYKRPREWEFTDELERTETGKKQRFKYRPS